MTSGPLRIDFTARSGASFSKRQAGDSRIDVPSQEGYLLLWRIHLLQQELNARLKLLVLLHHPRQKTVGGHATESEG